MNNPIKNATKAWVALGANLGDAKTTLLAAMKQLHQMPHSQLLKTSSLYRSAPVDAQGPDFINAVVLIETEYTALELLDQLQMIETAAGRLRPYRNAPRTLDLDIVLFGNHSIESERLTLPHPRMWQRAFVLLPLHEISPELVSAEQLAALAPQAIEKIEAVHFS